MKFGLFIDMQLPRPWKPGDEHRLFKDGIEQVELADALGYHNVWAQEHHFLEEYCHSSAPEVFLAACSQRTKRIRLGFGIAVCSPRFNPPARIAERVATLDLISDGRVEFGTGESGTRIELEAFGVDFVDKRPMWREAVGEIAKMMVADPYMGFEGRYFSMPCRNVVPKPLQRPHPPMWAACSNREALKLAARLGLGALTFAFINADEARFWVEEYYETFRNECTPIGRTVNPNIAMLSGFMVDRDSETARHRGNKGAQFFAFGLGHYWRDGAHVPGRTSVWELFEGAPMSRLHADVKDRRKAGMGGIGSLEEVVENFEALEAAGVDQLILLQQSGGYEQQHILSSLSLFGQEGLPAFNVRDAAREERKRVELEPYVRAAMERIPPLEEPAEIPVFEAYPRLWGGSTPTTGEVSAAERRPGASALWAMQVGGRRRQKEDDE